MMDKFTKNEILTLKRLNKERNPNIIRFIEIMRSINNTYYVYEYCNQGTLYEKLKRQKFFPEVEAIRYLKQLLNAMKTLQKHNIVHRDIKSDNILINNGVLKLVDFGFCYRIKNKEMLVEKLGSPLYMAPELLWEKPYDTRVDIYSIGCLIYELLFGNLPFNDRTI